MCSVAVDLWRSIESAHEPRFLFPISSSTSRSSRNARRGPASPHCLHTSGDRPRSRAVKLSEAAGHANLDLVVTGTVAAEFHGTIATSEAAHVQCRLQCLPDELAYLATRLKLELVPPEEANVLLAADRWGVGRVGAARPGAIPRLAHPIRIWCDMHVGRRGHELAALYKAEQLRG